MSSKAKTLLSYSDQMIHMSSTTNSIFISILLSALLIISVCCGTQALSTYLPLKHFGHADECNALFQFKNSLTINKRICNSACARYGMDLSLGTASWKEGSDCCTNWDGIKCDNVTGNVIKVNLTCSCLKGNLHSNSSLFSLRHLANLSLAGNHLAGSIPSSICRVSSLEYLDLSYNDLNDTILSCLGNLSNIGYLRLNDNHMSGPIPSSICRVGSLEYLDLSYNDLNDTILSCLGNLSSLGYLDLRGNTLGGSLPRSLANCTSLYHLDVGNNEINDTFPFWLAPSLVNLGLGSNHFHGLITLGNATFPFPSLEVLLIYDNHIHGHLPQDYFQLSNISFIHLGSNMFGGILPNPPINSQLYIVGRNRFTGEIPSTFCNITTLIGIAMSFNSLSGEIPRCLVTSTELEVLYLSFNSFQGTLPEISYRNNCNLKIVDLGNNHLQGELPPSWALCKNLVALDLSGNELGDSFPVWLEALQHLSILILRSNKFYGPITPHPETVHPFPMLQIFDISNNNFNGTLNYISNFNNMIRGNRRGILTFYIYNMFIAEWATLIYKGVEMRVDNIREALGIIDLSCNHFQDKIPNFIGNLQLLKGLDLSHSNLQGVIPSSLGNLTNLEWLDLSSNNFIGEIPSALTSLTSLAVFNVSMNHLTGEVPRGKQFETFQNDSYRGNPGLCGPPMSMRCTEGHPPEHPSEAKNEDDADGWMSRWIAGLMGYGIGTVTGISIGYLFIEIRRPPMWLFKMVERWQTRN